MLELAAPVAGAGRCRDLGHAAGLHWDEFVRTGYWDVAAAPLGSASRRRAWSPRSPGRNEPGSGLPVPHHPVRFGPGACAVAPRRRAGRAQAPSSVGTACTRPGTRLTGDQRSPRPPRPGGEWVRARRRRRHRALAVQLALREEAVVRDGGPSSAARVCGYGARVCSHHTIRSGRPACGRNSGCRGVGAAVNAAPGGRRPRSDGAGDAPGHYHRRSAPPDGVEAPTSTSAPEGHGFRAGRDARARAALSHARDTSAADGGLALQDAVAGRARRECPLSNEAQSPRLVPAPCRVGE